MQTIPLNSGAANAHQNFSIQLGENFLEFQLNYIGRSTSWSVGTWLLDIRQDDQILIAGAVLAAGAEITKNYFTVDIGQLFFVGDDATLDNLGIANSLVWQANG